MARVEGVIFDWAGTTVDFGCLAPVQAFLRSFQAAGVAVTLAEARAPMGMLKRDHIRAMLAMPRIGAAWATAKGRPFQEQDIEDIYSAFEPMLLASLHQYTQPLPGVVETVAELREWGLKIGSTTGYTDDMMKIVTAGASANGYQPDYWITPDSTHSCGRPYPYMIYRNMEELRLTAAWTVVKVGDTLADIREGVCAGVWSVGVLAGSSQMGLSYEQFYQLTEPEKEAAFQAAEQAFYAAGADFTIRTMEQLPTLLDHINEMLDQGARPYGK